MTTTKMTPSKLSRLRTDVEVELQRRSLYDFVRGAWHILEPGRQFQDNWHIGAICEHLEAASRGEILRLLINVPPRHMKSLLVSVCWQAWHWIDQPWTRWLSASYAQILSTRDTLKTRRLIQSQWYQERFGDSFSLAYDQNQKTQFANDSQGFRLGTSVGGMATGEGGDFQLVDDPHNVREAESDTTRESTLVWLDEVMSTRFNDPKTGVRVIIMQRVHERDVSGHVLEQGGYTHLCLPMKFERARLVQVKSDGSHNPEHVPKTPLGFRDPRTQEGELLWPERFGDDEVDEWEMRLGPYATAGQLQQRPAPRGGGMFSVRQVLIHDELPHDVKLAQCIRVWDLAGTDPEREKSLSDPAYTVGAYIGTTGDWPPHIYITDIQRFRAGPGDRDERIRQTAEMDGKGVTIWVEQEPGQSGKSQIAALRNLLWGYAVNPPLARPSTNTNRRVDGARIANPAAVSGSKVQRAEPLATAVAMGRVHVVRGPWLAALLHELETFPMGRKDQVDALSLGFNILNEKPPSTAEIMRLRGFYGR